MGRTLNLAYMRSIFKICWSFLGQKSAKIDKNCSFFGPFLVMFYPRRTPTTEPCGFVRNCALLRAATQRYVLPRMGEKSINVQTRVLEKFMRHEMTHKNRVSKSDTFLKWRRFVSFCVVAFRVVSCRVVLFHIVLRRFVSFRLVSCHVIPYRFRSFHLFSCRVISCRLV